MVVAGACFRRRLTFSINDARLVQRGIIDETIYSTRCGPQDLGTRDKLLQIQFTDDIEIK